LLAPNFPPVSIEMIIKHDQLQMQLLMSGIRTKLIKQRSSLRLQVNQETGTTESNLTTRSFVISYIFDGIELSKF